MTTNPPDEAVSAKGEEAVDEGAESVAGVTEPDTSSDPAVSWVESVDKVRSEAGLEFFSFLSAIDWSNEVEVGDPLESRVSERFEVLVRLSSVENNDAVTLSTDVSKEDPRLASLVDVFGGANWHEREAAEMFGIEFEGHPNLTKLYLPDAFEGFPLRKSFPLLSREVKPWPGLVDVEDQPSTENPEAGADQENAESEEGE